MLFDTNEALLRFLEDEGLGPFTLLKVTPKPTAAGKKVPANVVMEWGLEDLDHDGDRQRFLAWRVTAEAVVAFRSEGELDRFEECNVEPGDAGGIDLRLEAGGTLFLRCGRLVVSDTPVERLRKGRPRPHHGEMHLELTAPPKTWGAVRTWLAIPKTLRCRRHLTTTMLDDAARPKDAKHVVLVDGAGHDVVWLGAEGKRLTISRGKWAPDALWNDLWTAVTTVPDLVRITSRDLVCPPAAWPASPPPKPTPKVWPDVYGVACDFAGMTLGELRAHLGLGANVPFVFEGDNAPDPLDTLTFGEAARRNGGRDASGRFCDARAKPLVHCRADLREGVLSFRRERACDDATWLAVWRAPLRLPAVRERHSRTTCSPPDPWPDAPPAR